MSHFAQLWRLAAGGWRGSAARQTRWLSAHVQSKNTNTATPQPRAMHGCLTSKTSSIQNPRIQSATTFGIDRIERQSPPRTLEPDLNCFATTTDYIEMTFFSSLDDMRTIRMKVDQKAHDLFKEKPGQAPLTVTRILNPQETNVIPFEKDRKVLNLSDIKRLRNVRGLPHCVAAF
jgi:hypothetical protein